LINSELQTSGLHINISDLNWPESIQDGIKDLNTAMNATFVFYCIGIATAGLAMFTAFAAIFSASKLMAFGNFGIAFVSFLALAIGSIIVTVVASKMSSLINKDGKSIGLYAYKGGKYLALTWSATAVMLVATVAWIAEFCVHRRRVKREYTEKPLGRHSIDG